MPKNHKITKALISQIVLTSKHYVFLLLSMTMLQVDWSLLSMLVIWRIMLILRFQTIQWMYVFLLLSILEFDGLCWQCCKYIDRCYWCWIFDGLHWYFHLIWCSGCIGSCCFWCWQSNGLCWKWCRWIYWISTRAKYRTWVHFRVFGPFWSSILQWNRSFFLNANTHNPCVVNQFWISVIVNSHITYEVISKFFWSASVIGWTHILGCKTMYWCLRGVTWIIWSV